MTVQPNLFIPGSPKCGTTSLAHWLAQHPSIGFSAVKEPHFYNTDMSNRAVTDRARYEALFVEGAARPWRAEGSVWYLYSKDAVPNILKDCPEARFIVCLRDPISLLQSLHTQQLRALNEDVADLSKAWELRGERAEGRHVPPQCRDPQQLDYEATCCLGAQVARMLDHVARDKVHFVLMDDLRADSAGAFADVLAFLGLPRTHDIPLETQNTAKAVRSQSFARALKSAHALKRRLRLGRLGFGMTKKLKAINERDTTATPLDPAFRAELLDTVFAADIAKLEALTGRDLSAWTAREART